MSCFCDTLRKKQTKFIPLNILHHFEQTTTAPHLKVGFCSSLKSSETPKSAFYNEIQRGNTLGIEKKWRDCSQKFSPANQDCTKSKEAID